ncbi:MAG TPA: hypothetical protein VLB82_11465 [Thermodesulfobacteriota bacterium]|nr:hypothetical protein [Thermodesulfobacteriota bacterium]
MKSKYISLLFLTLAILTFYTNSSRAQYVWFDDIKEYKQLDQKKSDGLSKSIYQAIKSRSKLTLDSIDLKKHDYPNIVFISASDSITPAHVGYGSANNLINALNNALDNLYNTVPKDFDLKWLKVDIVKDYNRIDNFSFRKPITIDHTLYGIAFNQASGIALIPEEVNSAVIITNGVINKYVLASYLHGKDHRYLDYSSLDYWGNNTLYSFSTDSYFYDGNIGYKLFRGHRADLELDTETLHTSARLAGKYLLNAIQPDGSYIYRYHPEADLSANDYNILRHAGSTYSLLELFEHSGNESVLEKAKLAIDYLKTFTRECRLEGTPYLCVIDEQPGHLVKLGGNGLASAVLAKYIQLTEDKSELEYLNGVNSYILNAIKEDGSFYPHIVEFFTGNVSESTSDYYPGEAILGLLLSYELTNDKKLLDGAIKASDYLIKVRDKGKTVDNINHDHWLVYALSRLYKYKPDELYLNHIFKITDAIVKSQNNDSKISDINGSYYDIPRSTPAATRSEALFTAYNIAKETGNNKKADIYLSTLKKTVLFQLYNQYMPESSMYMADPQQTIGGFRGGYYNSEIQNDYIQHNLSSILGLLKIMEQDKQKSRN